MGKNYSVGYEIKVFDKFSKMLNRFDAKIKASASSVDKAKKRMDNFRLATGAVSSSLKRMAMVAGVAFATVTGLAVKSGAGFEKAKASFSALTGLAGKELETVSESALTSSKKYARSASEIMDGTRALASAKSELMDPKAVGSLNKIMGSVLTLSEIADISATQATESLVTALNTFGQKAKKPQEMAEWTADALDKIAYSAKIGKMPVQQLTMALGRSAGAMQGAGLTFEESLSALQVGALTGLKPSMIGRQMKNIAIKMKEANKQMGEEGFSFTDIIKKLAGKDLGITELTKAVGSENVLVMKSLLDYAKTGKKFSEAIKNKSEGASVEMFATKTKHFMFQVNKLWRTIEEKLIKVYEDLLGPILTKAVNQLVSFTDWIFSGTRGADALTLALGALATILTGIGVTLGATFSIGTFIIWKSMVIAGIAEIGGVANFFFGGLPMILGAVVSILPAIWGLSAWMRKDSKTSFFKVLLNDLKAIGSKIKEVVKYFAPAFLVYGVKALVHWIGAIPSLLAKIVPMLIKMGLKLAFLVAPLFLFIAKWMLITEVIKFALNLVANLTNGLMKFFGLVDDNGPIDLFSNENLKSMVQAIGVLTDFLNSKWDNAILNEIMEGFTGVRMVSDQELETARMKTSNMLAKRNRPSISNGGQTNINIVNNVAKDGSTTTDVETDTKANVKATTVLAVGSGAFGQNTAPAY